MDEKNNNSYTNYEPNFIMRDVPETSHSETSYTETVNYSTPHHEVQTPTWENRDPRDNFKVSHEDCSSGSWDNTNGFRASRRSRKASRKPSRPVTMTRKSLALLIVLCIMVSGAFGMGGALLGISLSDNSSETGNVADSAYRLYSRGCHRQQHDRSGNHRSCQSKCS